eukprot:11217196-Lingulodinium_polyedra.AAC.1
MTVFGNVASGPMSEQLVATVRDVLDKLFHGWAEDMEAFAKVITDSSPVWEAHGKALLRDEDPGASMAKAMLEKATNGWPWLCQSSRV